MHPPLFSIYIKDKGGRGVVVDTLREPSKKKSLYDNHIFIKL